MTDERENRTMSKRTEESLEGKEEAGEVKAMSRRNRRRQKETHKKNNQLHKENEGKWTTDCLTGTRGLIILFKLSYDNLNNPKTAIKGEVLHCTEAELTQRM